MSCVGYLRVSTTRQAQEGESLDVQRRQIEGYAQMHGLHIDQWFVEEGVSGSIPVSQRPLGRQMFAQLKPGDGIVSAKLDRLFRSALDALQVVDHLEKRSVRLHLLDLGGDLARNGMGRLFLTIAAAFAEAERDRIRERVATVKADQRARFRYLGGIVPFGFRAQPDGSLATHADEQAIIARILALSREGQSLRKISGYLAQIGVTLSHAAIGNIVRRTPRMDPPS